MFSVLLGLFVSVEIECNGRIIVQCAALDFERI
jgi:hypothetical protein